MFVFGYRDMGRLGSRARLLVMVLTVRKGTPPSGKSAEQQAINGIKLLWVTLLCINIYVFYYSGGKPAQMSDWTRWRTWQHEGRQTTRDHLTQTQTFNAGQKERRWDLRCKVVRFSSTVQTAHLVLWFHKLGCPSFASAFDLQEGEWRPAQRWMPSKVWVVTNRGVLVHAQKSLRMPMSLNSLR